MYSSVAEGGGRGAASDAGRRLGTSRLVRVRLRLEGEGAQL